MKLKNKSRKGKKALIVLLIVLLAVVLIIGVASLVIKVVDTNLGNEISYINIMQYPEKKVYYVGEIYDPTGLELQVVAKNGNNTFVKDTSQMSFSGFDSSEACDSQTVTISYMGFSVEINVIIKDPNATPPVAAQIEVFDHYDTYTLSEWRRYGFDYMGAMLRITYDDGTTEEITLDPQWIFDIDRTITSPGTTYITVKYPLDDDTVIEAKVPITITE